MSPATHSVLVVDSYPDTAEVTALVLTLHGITARIAHGCREALQVARTWPPTAIVLDIPLADGDGYELIRTICDILGYRPLVVVITAVVESEGRSRMAGCEHHLTKPADPRELVNLLNRHAVELQPLNV